MRYLSALALFVYLAPCCCAEDWVAVHDAGLNATRDKDFAAAVGLLEKSWDAAQTRVRQAVSANDLGIVLHQTGRESEARVWLERALKLWQADSADSSHVAESSASLALVDRMLGDYAGAEFVLRAAIEVPHIAPAARISLISTLGDIMREEGRFVEARQLLMEAENSLGSSLRQRLNNAIAIAELDRDTHNLEASIDEWTRTLVVARDSHELSAEASCIRGLGQTWLDRGNFARAEPLLRRALAMYSSPPLNDEKQTGSLLMSIGQVYLSQDKTVLAEESFDKALGIEERALGPSHPQIALVLELLADAVARSNRPELARSYLDRAVSIMTSRFGEQSAMTASVRANWGVIEERGGKLELAATQYRKALEVLNSAGADLDTFRNQVATEYARVLKVSHHKPEAAEVLAQARRVQ